MQQQSSPLSSCNTSCDTPVHSRHMGCSGLLNFFQDVKSNWLVQTASSSLIPEEKKSFFASFHLLKSISLYVMCKNMQTIENPLTCRHCKNTFICDKMSVHLTCQTFCLVTIQIESNTRICVKVHKPTNPIHLHLLLTHSW